MSKGIIRTAEAIARLLATHPNPELQTLLQAQADQLADYPDYPMGELGMFAIVQPGDDGKKLRTIWMIIGNECFR